MKRGLGRGLLFGLPVACVLWAAILVPLILWGWGFLLIDAAVAFGGVGGVLAARPRRERAPKPDYAEIARLEAELGMAGRDFDDRFARAQVIYHGNDGHAGPCTPLCPVCPRPPYFGSPDGC